MKATPNTVKL